MQVQYRANIIGYFIVGKPGYSLEYVFVLDDPDDEPTAEARLVYRPVIRPLAESKRWITKDILITSSAW